MTPVFLGFTAVMFQVEVFRFVMPCNVTVGYEHFGVPCCLHLQGEVMAQNFYLFTCSMVIIRSIDVTNVKFGFKLNLKHTYKICMTCTIHIKYLILGWPFVVCNVCKYRSLCTGLVTVFYSR
jgi:hypothetical protein